ncbi:DUF7657 domain-containing protein [Cellulomonas denverensis]|uniref:Glycosyltransferase RgtA/B/C/D-like domain-containing protein n=1 Tax=Cellulomonas denverensis TaxID=264297 RepID=A0A7X6QYU4_9CELL|nr:hypothetical protein [Cellulomonas denverensis]NKY22525.1 hypothetical protein [Cellulomonas denverensis]GIG24831.1 hypothetical protein Cde04nite_10750 [Cellulomonas denverensis]
MITPTHAHLPGAGGEDGTTVSTEAAPASHRATHRRDWLRRLPSPWIGVPVLVYLLLTVCGVTMSSIGIDSLREDPTGATSDQLGDATLIRTDEYLTSSPMAIGVMATGQGEDLNPLTAPQGFTSMLPTSPVSSVVLAENAVLRLGSVLPDQMLFAARWWLPTLLLFLGMPALLRPLVGSRWPGLFAAVLIAFSPATAWWSLSPLSLWGFTVAGTAALYRAATGAAERRPWWRNLLWAAAAALLLARTPLHYQPWAITAAPAILAVGIVPLLVRREGRRARILTVAVVGAASLLLAAGVFWENRASIAATSATVYPGARSTSGHAVPMELLFGATSLGGLKDAPLSQLNPSEISSSFLIAGVVALLLLLVGVQFRSAEHRAAVWALLVCAAPWAAWSALSFGGIGHRIPLANLVTPERAATMLGFLAVLLLALVLPGWRERGGWRVTTGTVIAVVLVAGYAASRLMMSTMPALTTREVTLSLVVLGLLVGLLVARPRWWVGYVASGAAALLLVWQVNPILIGLGDLRGSAVAQEMLTLGEESRADGVLWASNDTGVDALFAATGVPSLSSRQMAGPDQDAWQALDPGGAAEGVWNRGGSFIQFAWTDDPTLSFSNPAPDRIQISGSACTVHDRIPELERVVSTTPLDADCLTEVDTFTWGGVEQRVYEVTGA